MPNLNAQQSLREYEMPEQCHETTLPVYDLSADRATDDQAVMLLYHLHEGFRQQHPVSVWACPPT